MSKAVNPVSRRRVLRAGGALVAASSIPARAAPEAVSLAEKRRDELVVLLTRLVEIKSLSGESAEAAQAVVRDYLSELPYRIEESADRPSRYVSHPEFMPPNPPDDGPFVNVVGWPRSNAGARYAMFSHIDTHSIDPGWDTEPLAPVMKGGRMYGLGTADDKGGVAAMLVAASLLAERDEPLPVVMSLHGKGGGSRGSLPVFERIRSSDHRIGAVLYVHPAETGRGLEDVKNAVQGVLDLELVVRGWRGPPMEIGSVDSSAWEAGGNAIDMAWRALEHLRATAFDDVLVNLGRIEGGDRIGSVAEAARAEFRLKFDQPHAVMPLLEAARGELDAFRQRLGRDERDFEFEIDAIGYRTNPGAADWDAPVSRVLRDAIEDVAGRPPDAYPNHYAGDIRYPIRLLDVPAYGIGSIGGNFYGPNEWVDVDDLVNLVAVLVQAMSGWQGLAGARR